MPFDSFVAIKHNIIMIKLILHEPNSTVVSPAISTANDVINKITDNDLFLKCLWNCNCFFAPIEVANSKIANNIIIVCSDMFISTNKLVPICCN